MDKILAKIEKTNYCWNWTGYLEKGYGQYDIKGKHHRAHRLVYELLVGKIPEGLTIDHLCRNRRCVNPEHLEPVTLEENVRRARPFMKKKTHCKQGHEYSIENTYNLIRSSGEKERVCRICKSNAMKKYSKRVRGQAHLSGTLKVK